MNTGSAASMTVPLVAGRWLEVLSSHCQAPKPPPARISSAPLRL